MMPPEDLLPITPTALAAEQSVLRRLTELTAQKAPTEHLFAMVAEGLCVVLGVQMIRTLQFDVDGTAVVLAARGRTAHQIPPGTTITLPRGGALRRVFESGLPTWIGDVGKVEGPLGRRLQDEAVSVVAAAPILVDGRLWGAIMAGGETAEALPRGSEDRVAQFAGLVSLAVSSIEARIKVERLAAEQSALRRVAVLVAQDASPQEVFAVVTEELSRLLGVEMIRTVRYEPNGTATVVASQGRLKDAIPVGMNFTLPRGGVVARIRATGLPTWDDDFVEPGSAIGDLLRRERVKVVAGGPLTVDGRLWGAMVASAETGEQLPPSSAHRVSEFAELASMAISNIEARAKVERLAAEQSALRRVAVLVAQQASTPQVFAVVTEELSRLLDVDMVRTFRLNADGTVEILAALQGSEYDKGELGRSVPVPDGSVLSHVLRTGRHVRREYPADLATPSGGTPGARSVAGGPLIVNGQLWGAIVVGSTTPYGLPLAIESRVVEFAQLLSTSIANLEWRAEVERLAAEQSALRRVAELVARQPSSEAVFALVTGELSGLLGVEVVRTLKFEPDGRATVVAAQGREDDPMPPGTTLPIAPGGMLDKLVRTGRPARFEQDSRIPGARCTAGGPIVVGGQLWGAMVATASSTQILPPGSEDRVARFAELVSTAISNTESHAQFDRLVAEQSALRRIATLVARERPVDELFPAITKELGVLLEVDATVIAEYDSEGRARAVASWDHAMTRAASVKPLSPAFERLAVEVLGTGAPGRSDGAPAPTEGDLDSRSIVLSPIFVSGTTWGAIGAASQTRDALSQRTEDCLAEFGRHVATAVTNAKSRADLADSRARIVRAADHVRRRFERDLHDSAQQRLIGLQLELREVEPAVPPELPQVQRVLSRLEEGLNQVLANLRELSRGAYQAVLSEGGLAPALRDLARRSVVPVTLRLEITDDRRFEEAVEVAIYHVVSEAFANTARHAQASRIELRIAQADGWLELTARDNGKGGARTSEGSGLTGLVDVVEAIGGVIHVQSAGNAGTTIHVKLPTLRARGERS